MINKLANGIKYNLKPGNAMKIFSKHIWWDKSGKTCWMLLPLMVACVVVEVGAADFMIPAEENIDTPLLPMVFYGSVMINGEPAPDGKTILAKINDEVRGSAIVKDGRYGEPSYDRLIVKINQQDEGKPIQFYLESTPSNEIVIPHSGEVKQLDLSFGTTAPAIQPEVEYNERDRLTSTPTPEETPEIVSARNGDNFEAGGEGMETEPDKKKSDPLGIPGFTVTLPFCSLMIWLIIRTIKNY